MLLRHCKMLSLALLLLPLTLTVAANGDYPPNIPDAEAKPFKSIGDVTLNLYVFKPDGWKAVDKRPAAVFFFGGGWNHGSPEHFVPQCEALRRRGMVTVAADYRVASRNRTKGKDCVDDARDAMGLRQDGVRQDGVRTIPLCVRLLLISFRSLSPCAGIYGHFPQQSFLPSSSDRSPIFSPAPGTAFL